ncbi:MAG TPA: DUF192 domain-containing protein [Rhodocyclaceae bacterium]|jgi:hypothetical protein
MKLGAVYCRKRCVLPRVWKADKAWDRARGLLFRPPLVAGEGLWLEPCGSVHTIGMSYALDLAFIDEDGVVRKRVDALLPLRVSMSIAACVTLETAADELSRLGIAVGDHLEWRENP